MDEALDSNDEAVIVSLVTMSTDSYFAVIKCATCLVTSYVSD